MNKVFVYATLKKEKILEEALGEHHGKVMTPTVLPGYSETTLRFNKQDWPTLVQMGPRQHLPGELIDVTDAELAKLDKWEDHYTRQQVKTLAGEAWTYKFMRPGMRAALSEMAQWK